MLSAQSKQSFTKSSGQLETDWAICLIRWGLIAGVSLLGLLDPAQHLSPSHLVTAMILASAYNMIITLLLVFEFFPRIVPLLSLIVDTAGVLVLLHVSGGANSPFFFYPLFPILIGSSLFGIRFGLAVAAVSIVGLGLWTAVDWRDQEGISQVFGPVLYTLLYLLGAIMGGVAARHFVTDGTADERGLQRNGPFLPERVKLVYEMASTLSASLDYQRVLDAILDISRLGFDEFGSRFGETAGMVLLYDDDGCLAVASHRNLAVQNDATLRVAGRSGIVDQAISSSHAIIGPEPAADPELGAFQSLAPFKSLLCVPLRAGFETFGAVLFASVKPNAYTVEHTELLTIFCNQATVAMQNASLYQSLREERDKIIDREEEARHKLARDLHDGPTQDVAAIAMRLNFARLLVERDPVRAKSELARLEDLAHRTVREIRSMLFTLRPIILETEGLVAALNQYAENLRDNDGPRVEIDATQYQECLDMDAQGVVFAIIEEAVNNAKKHAEASRIWVQLAVQGDLFVAHVVDNGRGFDVAAVERDYGSRGSLGLVNLKERAELVEGSISIESAPGQGTRVTLIVPIEQNGI